VKGGAKAPGQVVGEKQKKKEKRKAAEAATSGVAAPSSPCRITCSNGTIWEELHCRLFSGVTLAEMTDPAIRVVAVHLKDGRQGGRVFQELMESVPAADRPATAEVKAETPRRLKRRRLDSSVATSPAPQPVDAEEPVVETQIAAAGVGVEATEEAKKKEVDEEEL
jgi:hypothetical protein